MWTEQVNTVCDTSGVFFRLPTFHWGTEENNLTCKVENNGIEFSTNIAPWRHRLRTVTLL